MKIRPRQLVSLGLTAALLSAPASSVIGANGKEAPRKKKPGLRAQLRSVFKQIRVVRTELRETKKEEARVSDQLQESQDRLELAQRNLRLSKEKVKAAEQEVKEATRRLRIAEERLALHQRRLSRRLAVNYMMGTVSYADVLLGSRSLADFLDRQYLLDKVLDSDVTLLRELREAQERVERERAALERKRVQLAAAQQAILVHVQKVMAEAAARAKLLAEIQNEREYQERMLDELEQDSSSITALLLEANRRLGRASRRGAFRPGRGVFGMPANGPITSGFGYRMHPVLGYRRFHCGLDIGAGFGAPVYAAASGTIFRAGFYRGYGRCIIVLHGNGHSTLYGHLSAISLSAKALRTGQVSKGELIGRVGSTGLSTGPHLHFEVRNEDGVPVNPATWLKH